MEANKEGGVAKSTWSLLVFQSIHLMRKVAAYISYANTLSTAKDHGISSDESHIKIRSRIKSNTFVTYEFLTMNLFATVIACCGLATNSSLAIFGAMTIAMFMDPIIGVALAIVEGEKKLLLQGLFTIVAGVVVVLMTSFVFSIFYRYHITNLPDSNLMQYATPHLLDLIIAIIGGAAGAYTALSRRLRVGLVGVALAITLMPPLAACGIFLAHGSLSLAAGCALSFITNLIGVQFTASLVFWVCGFRSTMPATSTISEILERNMISLVVIGLLAIMLGSNLKHVIEKQRFEQNAKSALLRGLTHINGAYLADLRFTDQSVIAVVRSPTEISVDQAKVLANQLPRHHRKNSNLNLRVVKVSDINTQSI